MAYDNHGSLLQWRRWDEIVGVIALVAIVFSICWGVVSRYIFPTPASWTYEVALLGFAYLVFFGAISGIRLGTHAAIDVVVDAFPMAWRKRVAWFNYVLLAMLFGLMAVLFIQQAITSAGVHSSALNLSRAWYYGPLAVASLGMFIQHLISDRPWRAETLERHADSII